MTMASAFGFKSSEVHIEAFTMIRSALILSRLHDNAMQIIAIMLHAFLFEFIYKDRLSIDNLNLDQLSKIPNSLFSLIYRYDFI